MRLELGSGGRPTEGFTHLDCRDGLPGVDIVDDATTLELVSPGSCSEIRACHLLEHLSHRDTARILGVWLNRLRPGGSLYVEVPNLEGHILAWQIGSSTDERFVTYLFGDQDYPENFHKTMFTPGMLERALTAVGFVDVQTHDFGLVVAASGRRP